MHELVTAILTAEASTAFKVCWPTCGFLMAWNRTYMVLVGVTLPVHVLICRACLQQNLHGACGCKLASIQSDLQSMYDLRQCLREQIKAYLTDMGAAQELQETLDVDQVCQPSAHKSDDVQH